MPDENLGKCPQCGSRKWIETTTWFRMWEQREYTTAENTADLSSGEQVKQNGDCECTYECAECKWTVPKGSQGGGGTSSWDEFWYGDEDKDMADWTTMSEEKFEERYPLRQNHLNRNASWNGCMFETFGEEVQFVSKQDPSTVWTLVDDGDGGECIMSGFHFVNRLGYLLSTVPVPERTAIEVQIAREELPDDGAADAEDIG